MRDEIVQPANSSEKSSAKSSADGGKLASLTVARLSGAGEN